MRLQVTRVVVKSPKISKEFDGYRAAVLADLHDCSLGKDNMIIRDALGREDPESLFIAGDMITESFSGIFHENARLLLTGLAKKYHVYYAMGNHELRWKNKPKAVPGFSEYKASLEKEGIVFLENSSVELGEGKHPVKLAGLDLSAGYYRKKGSLKLAPETITGLLGEADRDSFNVLLAHSPRFFDAYSGWGADLTISGHFHGGIIRLPLLGGVVSPYMELFPKYDKGLYRNRTGGCMLLSSGVGTHTFPRINNPPELVIIEFFHGKGLQDIQLKGDKWNLK